MNDLISRKALIEEVEKGLKGTHHGNNLVEKAHRIEHIHLLNVIANQPTAYDVERVIDELKNEFERHDKDRVYWQEHSWRDNVIYNGADLNEEQADAFKKAIEIVKGAAKDD